MRIPSDAPKAVGLAADEFAKYWKLVTGRDFTEEADAVAYFKIDSALDAAHDEYLIRSVADGVEFTGATQRTVSAFPERTRETVAMLMPSRRAISIWLTLLSFLLFMCVDLL